MLPFRSIQIGGNVSAENMSKDLVKAVGYELKAIPALLVNDECTKIRRVTVGVVLHMNSQEFLLSIEAHNNSFVISLYSHRIHP